VVAAGVPEFQPVPKSLFDSNVDVVSGDGAGVDAWKLTVGPPNLCCRRRNDIGQRLQKDSDSPSIVNDCAFARGTITNAARIGRRNETHFALLRSIVIFLSLLEFTGPAADYCAAQ